MSKFKVGDRVRDLVTPGNPTATVSEVMDSGLIKVKWDRWDRYNNDGIWEADDFDLIEPATTSHNFKIGDRIRLPSARSEVYTVVSVEADGKIRLSDYMNPIPADGFEIISPETKFPVRVKTVNEIVPGVYGRVVVGGFVGGSVGTRSGDQLAIDFVPRNSGGVAPIPRHCLTATELREAARVFEQLAEAIEDE